MLFRYFSDHWFDTLRDQRLKVSKASEYNDPFDCRYRVTGSMTQATAKSRIREAIRTKERTFLHNVQRKYELPSLESARRYAKKNLEPLAALYAENLPWVKRVMAETGHAILDEIVRVICFSSSDATPSNEILLWSHYARSHRGVRLGFVFPEGIESPCSVKPVRYCDLRAEYDVSRNPLSEEAKDQLITMLRVKSKAWSYESEYRLLTTPAHCVYDPEKAMEHLPFKKDWLAAVDFGVRCPYAEVARALELIRSEYPNIRARRARYHPDAFELEYDELSGEQRPASR